MATSIFHSELNSYETILAAWAKFAVKTCVNYVQPNGLEQEENGSLWMLYEVGESELPMRCKNGKVVRVLKMGLTAPKVSTIH